MTNVGFKTAVIIWFFVVFGVVGSVIYSVEKFQREAEEEYLYELGSQPNSPTSLIMYNLIEKYSKEYHVPRYVAYNVAYLETKYRGPFDWNYNPYLTSSAGAVGPMQIMPSTARGLNRKKVSTNQLRTDLEYNIMTSMKLLSKNYRMYGSWAIACGCYNTGRPIVNDYGSFCASNKNYKKNWVTYSR